MRGLCAGIRRHEVPVTVAATVLGVYLAVANVLIAAKRPSAGFWMPWKIAFIFLLVAAIGVPLYALYKSLDVYFERQVHERAVQQQALAEQERKRAALDRDLVLFSQQIVAEIADDCYTIRLTDLAAQVWICRADETFDRRARFFLPHERPSSGVQWKKGKGVAGFAWLTGRSLAADLKELNARREELGPLEFDALPADERFGITAAELEATSRYTGIVALPLFSTVAPATVLAIFSLDYTGRDEFDCVVRETNKWRILALLGGCAKRLTQEEQSTLTGGTTSDQY